MSTELRPKGYGSLFSPLHILLQSGLALLFFFAGELDRKFGLWFVLVPILGVPAIAVGVTWVVGIARSSLRRDWMRAASVAAAPLIVWPLLILALHKGFDSHWLRFQITKSGYEASIQTLRSASPAYHSWDWGTTGGAASVNIFHSLIYDETDQTPRRAIEASKDFETQVRGFGGHFYLVTQIYQ
ncbi:MAG: hypothetical protein V4593_12865 [Pseudomonadota bacterium]